MSEKKFFPTWVYHETLAPEGKIIQNEAEEKDLGPGWVDTPAKFSLKSEPTPSAQEETEEPEQADQEEVAELLDLTNDEPALPKREASRPRGKKGK